MRIERQYELRETPLPKYLKRAEDGRDSEFVVECTEARYCEDATCEATHDDPSAKWDTRTYYSVCLAYGRANADEVIRALRLVEANARLMRIIAGPR